MTVDHDKFDHGLKTGAACKCGSVAMSDQALHPFVPACDKTKTPRLHVRNGTKARRHKSLRRNLAAARRRTGPAGNSDQAASRLQHIKIDSDGDGADRLTAFRVGNRNAGLRLQRLGGLVLLDLVHKYHARPGAIGFLPL